MVQESKRIKRLRQDLIKNIPRQPNTSQSLAILEQERLSYLILLYLNRVSRFISTRKRKIKIEPTLTNSPYWKNCKDDINIILHKARNGDDLSPHLSTRVLKEGVYLHQEGKKENWADKDLILNVMGYHHLHLSSEPETSEYNKRTNLVLFVQVTRTELSAIGLFDHSVFCIEPGMSKERRNLWNLFDKRSSIGKQPGEAYFMTDITMSGHCGFHVDLSLRYAKLITNIDPLLDDADYLKSHFRSQKNNQYPEKYKLRWVMDFMDIGVLDERSNVFCIVQEGPQ